MRGIATGGMALTLAIGFVLTFVHITQIREENTRLRSENNHILTQLAHLDAGLAQLRTQQQETTAFRGAAEEALRHLLAAEVTRSPAAHLPLLHRVQADDSTTNSPFAILSEHFATKDWVIQQIQQALADYVTKQELDQRLADLPAGGAGGRLVCLSTLSYGTMSIADPLLWTQTSTYRYGTYPYTVGRTVWSRFAAGQEQHFAHYLSNVVGGRTWTSIGSTSGGSGAGVNFCTIVPDSNRPL